MEVLPAATGFDSTSPPSVFQFGSSFRLPECCFCCLQANIMVWSEWSLHWRITMVRMIWMWLILLLTNIHHLLSFLLKWQSSGPNVMAELFHQPGKLKRNLRLLNMIGMHEMTLERWNEYGSSDALWSSKMSWCKDVAVVDINMGCSKSFSISGGMGTALLTKPELIHDVSSSEIFGCSVVHHSYFSLLDEFGVEGIPHFAFLDKDGNEEGNIVGRLSRKYVLQNADALALGETTVSHACLVGQYSSAEARKVHQVVDPRSHE